MNSLIGIVIGSIGIVGLIYIMFRYVVTELAFHKYMKSQYSDWGTKRLWE